jgi:hypothetical protein
MTAQRRTDAALAELNAHLEERVRTEVAAREEAQAREAAATVAEADDREHLLADLATLYGAAHG